MKVCCFVKRFAVAAAVAEFAFGFWAGAAGGDTVQVNITSILDARSVSTFSNGKIYTWTKGIDGNGTADGYVTTSVAVHQGRTDVLALPDSARFPANANHPTMLLHYSNSDSTDPQTHYLSGIDSVTVSVTQGNYSTIYVALTSSEGSSAINVVLNYSDGPVTSSITLPDYAQGLTTGFFYVDSNLSKWTSSNTVQEAAGHNIDGYGVPVNSAKTLTSVKLVKTTQGSYMVLWGVTAVLATSTAVSYPATERAPVASAIVQSSNGIARIANVKAGSTLTLYSPSGEIATRFHCANGGIVSVGAGNGAAVRVAPGMYVCELRAGNDRQTLQMLVPR